MEGRPHRLLPASRGGGPSVASQRRRRVEGRTPVSSPLRGEGDRPKPRRGEGGWRGADRTLLPTPPPSFGWSPSPFAARTGRRRDAHNPPIASISRAANLLIPLAFQKSQRHEPSVPGPVPDSSHPVGGEGVGSSAPMSAGCGRAMKPGGWILRGSLQGSMDGSCLLAARFPRGPLAPVAMSAARRRQQCLRRDPVRSELRATTRKARGKRLRGAGLLRRNGNSTTAPGEARPPRALPDPPRKQAAKSHAPIVLPPPKWGGTIA